MRGWSTFALTLAAASASACATVQVGADPALSWGAVKDVEAARILAEQPAPAPAGLLAFCERAPGMCVESGDFSLENERARPDTVLHRQAAWEPRPLVREGWSAGGDGAAIFARLLDNRVQSAVFHYEHYEAPLSEASWRQLRLVNHEVNSEILVVSDADNYGVAEYWAMPLEEQARATPGGDCEDFALEKRERLISLGWDRRALSLAVVHSAQTGFHAVLVAQTDRGDFVLDNLYDEPRTPQSLHYAWLSRQAGSAMTIWATAQLELTPPHGAERGGYSQAVVARGSAQPASGGPIVTAQEHTSGSPDIGMSGR